MSSIDVCVSEEWWRYGYARVESELENVIAYSRTVSTTLVGLILRTVHSFRAKDASHQCS